MINNKIRPLCYSRTTPHPKLWWGDWLLGWQHPLPLPAYVMSAGAMPCDQIGLFSCLPGLYQNLVTFRVDESWVGEGAEAVVGISQDAALSSFYPGVILHQLRVQKWVVGYSFFNPL